MPSSIALRAFLCAPGRYWVSPPGGACALTAYSRAGDEDRPSVGNRAVEVGPVGWLKILDAFHDVEIVGRFAIDAAMHGLDLQKRIVGVERDRHVRPGEPQFTNSGPNQRSVSMMPS